MRAVAIVVLALLLCPSALRAADGDLDPSFGSGGIADALPAAVSIDHFGGLAIQSDGKIVAGGSVGTPPSSVHAAAVRLDAEGNPDPSFGSGGVVVAGFDDFYATSMALAPDGGVLEVGGIGADIALVRFTAAGAVDTSFGTGGLVTTQTDCAFNGYHDVVLARPDGSIVVARINTGSFSSCVVGYRADGSLDPSFGSGAPLVLPGWFVRAATVQSDGKVLIAGSAKTPNTAHFAVGRLLRDGTFDARFGDGGIAKTDATSTNIAAGAAVQPNGSVVAVDSRFSVVSFRSNGSLDPSFGVDGVSVVTVTGGSDDYESLALAVQPDGKIVVGGVGTTFESPPPNLSIVSDLVLVRYGVDGSLDPTYGSGGVQQGIASIFPSASLGLQPDGKAVALGVGESSGDWLLVRTLGFSDACPATPVTGCKTPTAALASTLQLVKGTTPAKNHAQWKWKKGADTTLADFGDPIGGDRVLVCAYDESGMTPTLAAWAVVPGGGTCNGKPCWKPLGTTGVAFGDPTGTRFGINGIKLMSGTGGKASIQLKGRVAGVALPSLPLDLPLRWQLVTEGACFESVFSTTGAGLNSASKFKGKSD